MTDGTRTPAGRHPVQSAALGVSIVFLLIGVLGFIPGVTTGYDQLAFAGYRSDALLRGLFNVSVLHNLVHLLFGIIGLAMARTPLAARQFLIYGGAVYAVLFVYGLLIGQASPANF